MAKKRSTKKAGASTKKASKSSKKKGSKSAPKKKSTKKTTKSSTKRAAAKSSKKSTKKSAKKSTKSTKKSKRSTKATAAKKPAPAKRANAHGEKSNGTVKRNAGGKRIKTIKPPDTAIAHFAEKQDNNAPLSLTALRKADSGLSRKEKEYLRRLLLEKRADILGDVESLHTSAFREGGELSNMPLHMADVGSDNYEQEATLGLMESEQKLLREVNEALERMSNGTYGVCLESGKAIGMARLEYKPWAKYCIEVARERERLGKM